MVIINKNQGHLMFIFVEHYFSQLKEKVNSQFSPLFPHNDNNNFQFTVAVYSFQITVQPSHVYSVHITQIIKFVRYTSLEVYFYFARVYSNFVQSFIGKLCILYIVQAKKCDAK